MRDGAPIRFLFLMLGGWTCLRLATLAPGWWDADSEAFSSPVADQVQAERPTARVPEVVAAGPSGLAEARTAAQLPWARHNPVAPPPSSRGRLRLTRFSAVAIHPIAVAHADDRRPPLPPALSPTPPSGSLSPSGRQLVTMPQWNSPAPSGLAPAASRRWSGSAWLLARRDGGAALAPGGTLGGSQAGARLLYRLNDDAARLLSLAARLYAPLRRPRGAEAALGIDWRPVERLPVHLLVERRQRLGRDGRSAFSIAAYGGGSASLGFGWRLDGYAQAGFVGARSRDAFVDGSVRVARALGPVEVGGALWGAAQPGASRLDGGPQLSVPIRTRGASLRLSAEYPFRIAGDARPASGPALTLGVDF